MNTPRFGSAWARRHTLPEMVWIQGQLYSGRLPELGAYFTVAHGAADDALFERSFSPSTQRHETPPQIMPISTDSISAKVIEVLKTVAETDEVERNLDLPLYDSQVLDSMKTVELIVAIAQEFGVDISPAEFEREKWATPRLIIADIENRIASVRPWNCPHFFQRPAVRQTLLVLYYLGIIAGADLSLRPRRFLDAALRLPGFLSHGLARTNRSLGAKSHRSGRRTSAKDRTLTYGELRAQSDALAAHLDAAARRQSRARRRHRPQGTGDARRISRRGEKRASLRADRSLHPAPARRADRAKCRRGAHAHPGAGARGSGRAATRPPDRGGSAGEDPYYIIFTSGSTGEPKGVVITLNCLDDIRGLDDRRAEVSRISTETFLNQAPFSFDLSVMDLYLSLATRRHAFQHHQGGHRQSQGLYQAFPRLRHHHLGFDAVFRADVPR